MKKAFSTLGCPTWSFSDIISVAKDIGMNGIEIRGIGYQMHAPSLNIFNDNNLEKTLAILKRTGLEISMLTTGCDLSTENFDNCLEEANDYMNLADKIGAPYIRIMCEGSPKPTKELNLSFIAKRYAQICDMAKDKKVLPLIETNACLANSEIMLEFLNLVNRDNAKVLWDIHHPYRFFNESVDFTFNNLSKYIKYIHLKDSVMNGNNVEYRMMGYGDVPIKEAVSILKKSGYDGYLSLEWVKRWCPQLEESGVAFPQYANYIDDLD